MLTVPLLIKLFKDAVVDAKAIKKEALRINAVKALTGTYVAKLTALGVDHVDALLMLNDAYNA